MTSFNQLLGDKILKRADAMKARLSDIKIKEGFNWRHAGADLDAYVEELAQKLELGASFPDIWLDSDLNVREGHCRFKAYNLVDSRNPAALNSLRDKDGVIWLTFKPFTGTELEAHALVYSSQDNRKLSPLEVADGYRAMRDLGASNDDIARVMKKSRAHVDQMFILDSAPVEVKEAVKAGDISSTEAVKLVRDHKEDSAEELANRKAVAGGKVTAKVAPKKPKQDATTLIQAVRGFVATIDDGIKERILMGTLEYVEVDCAFLAEIIEAAAGLTDVDAGLVSAEERLSLLGDE